MAETNNYGLYLTDNDQESFISWREKINGQTDSNMIKIDSALSGKADKSVTIEDVLSGNIIDSPGDGWYFNNSVGTYIYFLQCDIKEADNGVISISKSATLEQRDAARNAMLFILHQVDGAIIIGIDGDVPDIDIPITIIVYN